MASRALIVATVAGVLLLVSIGVDATVNRTYHLEARSGGEWIEIAASKGRSYAYATPAAQGIVAGPNETVQLRIRAENGYPWADHEAWSARVNGILYAQGTLDVPAGGSGEAAFSIPAKVWYGAQPAEPAKPVPNGAFGNVEVQIGKTYLSGGFSLTQGASA